MKLSPGQRRLLLHISFWVIYILQDMLLAISWYGPAMHEAYKGSLWIMALHAALSILPPKLLLSYFLLYVSIPKIMDERSSYFRVAIETIIVAAFSIFLYRAISFYYVFPYVYGNVVTQENLLDTPTVLISLIDIGFIVGLAVAMKFVRLQARTKEKEKLLVKEKLETELKFLRNQTNPHFLLNTLNNIYALARKGSEETAESVLRLSELLQFMLYESSGKSISLKDEIKVFESYLELEMIRYNNRLSVSFNKETDREDYPIAPLLLLPFIENAFKHGVSETRFDSFVNIELKVKNGLLDFYIENTFHETRETSKKACIGLKNVRRQLELTYRKYDLDVNNSEDMFRVKLTLDLESLI